MADTQERVAGRTADAPHSQSAVPERPENTK